MHIKRAKQLYTDTTADEHLMFCKVLIPQMCLLLLMLNIKDTSEYLATIKRLLNPQMKQSPLQTDQVQL